MDITDTQEAGRYLGSYSKEYVSLATGTYGWRQQMVQSNDQFTVLIAAL